MIFSLKPKKKYLPSIEEMILEAEYRKKWRLKKG